MPSSVIQRYHYDDKIHRLRVHFVSGLIYDYLNIPGEVYEKFRTAFSKGKFLNEQIKGKFKFEKIGDAI